MNRSLWLCLKRSNRTLALRAGIASYSHSSMPEISDCLGPPSRFKTAPDLVLQRAISPREGCCSEGIKPVLMNSASPGWYLRSFGSSSIRRLSPINGDTEHLLAIVDDRTAA